MIHRIPIEPGHLSAEVTTLDGVEHWPIVAIHLAPQPGGGEVVDDYEVVTPAGATVALSELHGGATIPTGGVIARG